MKKVLIVDDEESLTGLVKLNLEDTGDYEVREINDPQDAIETARLFRPDVIILDIVMPRLSGTELAENLKKFPGLDQIPIIFLSAAVSRENPMIHDDVIKDAVIMVKPVSIDELIESIETAIQGAKESA